VPKNNVHERGQRRGGAGSSDLLAELEAIGALGNAVGAQKEHNGQNAKGSTVTVTIAAAAGGGKNDTCPGVKTSTITVTQQGAAAAGTGYENLNSDG
jgi:hypothetical protein